MERFISNFERQLFINEANRIEKLIDSGYLHELAEYNHWVVYKTEYWYNRRIKIPYNPLTSHRARVNDPGTWSSYKPALNALRSGLFNGIGFVTAKDDPFIFVDVDRTAGYNREIYYPGRQAIELLRTCWEYSPGDGIHGIGRGTLPFANKKLEQTEIYTSSHYMTLTFKHIPGTPTEILPVDKQILRILQHRESVETRESVIMPPTPKQPLESLPSERLKENVYYEYLTNPLLQRLMDGNWQGRYPSQSEADMALVSILLTLTGNNAEVTRELFLESGLNRPKTLRKLGNSTYLDVTIENELKKRKR